MNRRHIILGACALLAVVLIGSIAALLYSRHMHTSTSSPTTKDVVTKTLTNPGRAQPSASTYTSTAGPNEPAYISLPTINSKGYIQKVGVDQYSQIAAPTNVYLAGWYVNSLLPGQAGLSIIDGHVDGYYHNQGIFGRLNKLKPGDRFSITFGNGSSKLFSVKSLQLIATGDVPRILFSHDPTITNQLNLITCGGNYDGVSHTYDKRTIVISSLIK